MPEPDPYDYVGLAELHRRINGPDTRRWRSAHDLFASPREERSPYVQWSPTAGEWIEISAAAYLLPKAP